MEVRNAAAGCDGFDLGRPFCSEQAFGWGQSKTDPRANLCQEATSTSSFISFPHDQPMQTLYHW